MNHSSSPQVWTSLRIQLAALTSLLLLSLTLALTLISIQREQVDFRTEIEADATILLETLGRTATDPLLKQNIAELNDIADTVTHDKDIPQTAFYNDKGIL